MCQQIYEHEQSLKSAQNYKECFQKLLHECPPLGNYLNKNIIPWSADWPGWYYPKKNIALGKCSHLRQSVIPEQGQFHVSLNAAEDAVTIFKHFFEKLFKTVFRDRSSTQAQTIQSYIVLDSCSTGLALNPRKSSTEIWNLQRPWMCFRHISTWTCTSPGILPI